MLKENPRVLSHSLHAELNDKEGLECVKPGFMLKIIIPQPYLD